MTLLEEVPCTESHELHVRERYHIENTAQCVNERIPSRGAAEIARNFYHNKIDKDARRQQMREYYAANKEAIRAKVQEKREKDREPDNL
jgi:hypothetical protein